ncbi:MAG TPA: hypothetical protein PKC49_00415 [Phycisphaerae bacterium]|nr:hypothetical protein [Phycisphaerae bacterium]
MITVKVHRLDPVTRRYGVAGEMKLLSHGGLDEAVRAVRERLEALAPATGSPPELLVAVWADPLPLPVYEQSFKGQVEQVLALAAGRGEPAAAEQGSERRSEAKR